MKNKYLIKIVFFIIIIIVAILGGYLILRATNWGPWAYSDSAAYISAARNFQIGLGSVILNSNGSITPITEFPPFFPYLLSIITSFQGNFIQSTRWLNIILFMLSIVFTGLIAQITLNNYFLSIFAASLITISPLMIDSFSGFMSEPLFIAILLILIFYFIQLLLTQKSRFLIPVFIFSSILPLVRYAGILFVSCIAVCIFLFRKIHRQNLKVVFPLYIFTSYFPISIWFLNQYSNMNKIGGKRFELSLNFLKNFIQSIWQEVKIFESWIPYYGIYPSKALNQGFIFAFSAFFMIAIVIGLLANLKIIKLREEKALYLFNICLLLFIAYISFIAFTHSIAIPKIDIINRMLAPIFPFLVMIIISAYVILPKFNNRWIINSVYLLFFLVTIRFYEQITLKNVETLFKNGEGFTAKQYQTSSFLEELHKLPSDQPMVSNSAAFVLFYINRFPLQIDQFQNWPYGNGDGYGEKSFREKNAALIITFSDFHNYYGKNSNQLLANLTDGLVIDYHDDIGGIYYFPD